MLSAAEFSIRRRGDGQTVVLLFVVLAVLAGIAWLLWSARETGAAEARAFAREVATRLAIQRDPKFLSLHLGQEAQVQFPPSFRERLLNNLNRLGTPTGNIEVDGKVLFESYFFQPKGHFAVRIDYPAEPALLYLAVSRPRGWWQIDYLNLTWTPAPASLPAGSAPSPKP